MWDVGAETSVGAYVKYQLLLFSFMNIHLVVLESSHMDTWRGGFRKPVLQIFFYELATI
jgi:hypothetical protein